MLSRQLETLHLTQPNSLSPPRRGLTSVKKVPSDLGPMPRVALAWRCGLCTFSMTSSFEVCAEQRACAAEHGPHVIAAAFRSRRDRGHAPACTRLQAAPYAVAHWLCTNMSVVSFVRERSAGASVRVRRGVCPDVTGVWQPLRLSVT